MNTYKKVCFTSLSILCLAISSAVFAVKAPSTVVLSGIDSPRGMDLDSKGNLYLASSGFGGPGAPFNLSRSEEVGPICAGNSGKVYKVTPKGQVTTLVSNLPSHADCQDFNGPFGPVLKGGVAAGPNGLRVSENSKGQIKLLMSFSGSTEVTNEICLPGGAILNHGTPFDTVSCLPGYAPINPYSLVLTLAQLWGPDVLIYNTVGQIDLSNSKPYYQVTYGQMKFIEDIFNIDSGNTAGTRKFPFPTNKENDVYDLLQVDDRILAVDSGANAIWSLKNGLATVAVVMPNVGCSVSPCIGPAGQNLPESVPTAIAKNPANGKIYIGELAGFAFAQGRIFLADFSTTPATLSIVNVHDSSGNPVGTTALVGMDFDTKGNLYVVEYTTELAGFFGAPGAVLKLHFNNPLDATATVFDDETLVGPTGITIGNGKIYVGNKQDTGLHMAEVRAFNLP